jgi:predicted RNA-binding Zn-ribbon protein involved in translation (DUF1610 family)
MSKLAHSCDWSMAEIEANADQADPMWKCPRCGQVMEDRDCAEGCEDLACPALGGE